MSAALQGTRKSTVPALRGSETRGLLALLFDILAMESLSAKEMADSNCHYATKADFVVRNLVDCGLIAEGDRVVYKGDSAEVTYIGTLKWRNGEYASVYSWVTAVVADKQKGRKQLPRDVDWATLVNGKSLVYWKLLLLLALQSSYGIDKYSYPNYYTNIVVPKDMWHELLAELDNTMENGMFRCRVPTCRELKPTLELRHLHEMSHSAADRLQLRGISPTAEAAPRNKRTRDDDDREAESATQGQLRRAGARAAGPNDTPPAANSYIPPAHAVTQAVLGDILAGQTTPSCLRKAPATGASSAKSAARNAAPATGPRWTADAVWGYLRGRGLSDAGLNVLWDHQINGVDFLSYVEGRALGDRFGKADTKLVEEFVAAHWDALKNECRRD